MRNTAYAKELASAAFAGARIERIFVCATRSQRIRFSDWNGGRFNPRALEIREGDLAVLIGDAIAVGVFSRDFVTELTAILGAVVDPI